MAGDSEATKPTDKGKGKVVDDPKKDKSLINGKKEDEKVVDCTQNPQLSAAGRWLTRS